MHVYKTKLEKANGIILKANAMKQEYTKLKKEMEQVYLFNIIE